MGHTAVLLTSEPSWSMWWVRGLTQVPLPARFLGNLSWLLSPEPWLGTGNHVLGPEGCQFLGPQARGPGVVLIPIWEV